MNTKVQSIKSRYNLNSISHTLGYCPITGITLEVKIPQIPSHLILTYKNPLADFQNAKALISLNYSEIGKTSNRVLAGCLLSILNYFNLIEDKLSSIERNEILCLYPQFQLYETAKIIISYSDSRIADFPRISLAECCTYHIPSLLKTYITSCINSGDYYRRSDTVEIIRTTTKIKTKNII